MGLVDADYRFLYIDVGCNGRVSDGGVFANCSLSTALSTNTLNIPGPKCLPQRASPMPHVIVADDAFAMKTYIMKPYPFRNQPIPKRVFNYRLSRARRVVENAFGILASRFRVLHRPILLQPDKAIKVVKAICAIHNFLLKSSSSSLYASRGFGDNNEWEDDLPNNQFIPLQVHNDARAHTYAAREVRSEFEEYFVHEGEVPWQLNHIAIESHNHPQ